MIALIPSIVRIILGLVLASVPLVVLGMRNWRAVPLGGLIMAFSGIGGLGALSMGGLGSVGRAVFVLVLLAIAAAFAINMRVVGVDRWILISFAAWFIATSTYLVVAHPAVSDLIDKRNAAAYEVLMAKNAADSAARARTEEEANQPPFLPADRRAALLDGLLERIRAERPGMNLAPVARFVRFGDPVVMPESVTVWVVYPMPSPVSFRESGGSTRYLFQQINRELRAGGYPAPVAIGAVSEEIVRAAGGDEAYWGARGERRLPQFTSDVMPRGWDTDFPPPSRASP